MRNEYLSSVFGLVTKHDPTTENGGIFLAYYLTLKKILDKDILTSDYLIYICKMGNAKVDKGLYKRSSHHTIRTVSHDEITGFLVGSKILRTGHGREVISFLERNLGCYPATGELKFYRFSDYYAWGHLTNRFYANLFFFNYFVNLLFAIHKDKTKTSSKLIYFCELYNMKDKSVSAKFLWKLFTKKMRKDYGDFWVKELFAIYFHTEENDHPLIELSRQVQNME